MVAKYCSARAGTLDSRELGWCPDAAKSFFFPGLALFGGACQLSAEFFDASAGPGGEGTKFVKLPRLIDAKHSSDRSETLDSRDMGWGAGAVKSFFFAGLNHFLGRGGL